VSQDPSIEEEFEAYMDRTEQRIHHTFIGALVSMSIIALTTAGALVGIGLLIRDNHRQTVAVEKVANQANDRAEHTAIKLELSKEKVCSESSDQPVACRALFERLSGNLSEEQRMRLACIAILYLEGPLAGELQRQNPQCKQPKVNKP
jgi:hypothetical protein